MSAGEGCGGAGGAWRVPTTLFLLGLASSYLQLPLSALLPAAPLPAAACTKAGPSPNSPHVSCSATISLGFAPLSPSSAPRGSQQRL